MDWMTLAREFWLNRLAWLAGLAAVFAVLARLTPCNRGMHWWKAPRAAVTDLLYWLIVPLFLHVCLLFLVGLGDHLLYGGRGPESLPTRQWPVWLQLAAILLLQDVWLYWAHRAFHGRLGWRFHTVHHSPKVLDWLSTQRFHPVNDLLAFVLADVFVLLAGFSPAVAALLVPFNIAYSALVHANLNWTFGPLRYVLASPVFHRWHHTSEEQGLDKNFASTFPFLDLLFGTFYMPAGELPENFGNGEPDFPEGFWGQLVYPVLGPASPQSPGRARRALRLAAVVAGVGGVLLFALHFAGPTPRAPQAGEEESESAALVPALPVEPARGQSVLAVALSADGRRAASGGEDCAITIRDAATRAVTHTLKGHTRPVRALALSGDGRCIVSGGQDGTVRVWDAETGAQTLSLTASPGFVLGVAVSADGSRAAAATVDGTVKVWDTRTGAEKFAITADAGAVLAVALSGDGESLAFATGRTVKVWRVPASRQTLTLEGHTDLVYSLAMSPDGRRVVSGSFDQTARVWDAGTGEATATLVGHAGPVYSVALSGDGRTVVTGGKDGAVMVWDGATGRVVSNLAGHADSVTGVAVRGDGNLVVSGGRDGAVKFWSAEAASGDQPE
jgi:WD40 repeat protein/sterol desaturase/sphingolipid hydroxylase (fatty acid hydroxylase superfamily)